MLGCSGASQGGALEPCSRLYLYSQSHQVCIDFSFSDVACVGDQCCGEMPPTSSAGIHTKYKKALCKAAVDKF